MLEAIHTFNIKDYRVLLCLSHSELPRKNQLFEFFDKYKIQYELESIDYKITKIDRLRAVMPKYNKYKTVFIGDCNNELLIFKAFTYTSNGGTLLYLDDGIATIQFYNGLCQLNRKLKSYYNLLCKIRDINFDKYFFTIYHDLRDNKHITIANKFRYLTSLRQGKNNKGNIVFLGTCTDDFCRMERIKPHLFLSEQHRILARIRHNFPKEKIIFVPHGRDVYDEPKQSCHDLGISYQPSDISVEMNLLGATYTPVAVYGFTSSALYNLKLMLPDSEIVNITFSGNQPENDRIEITSQYYSKHGIKRIIWPLQK